MRLVVVRVIFRALESAYFLRGEYRRTEWPNVIRVDRIDRFRGNRSGGTTGRDFGSRWLNVRAKRVINIRTTRVSKRAKINRIYRRVRTIDGIFALFFVFV